MHQGIPSPTVCVNGFDGIFDSVCAGVAFVKMMDRKRGSPSSPPSPGASPCQAGTAPLPARTL